MCQPRPWPRATPFILGAFLIGSCERSPETVGPEASRSLALDAPQLLHCPQETVLTASATLDQNGGTIGVRGHEIQVPAGALPGPVLLRLTVPIGSALLLDITADEQEHYQFQEPVRISMDYGRCPGWEGADPLSAWYYDYATGAFLENMGGSDDRPSRKFRFFTNHLSGYVIAD